MKHTWADDYQRTNRTLIYKFLRKYKKAMRLTNVISGRKSILKFNMKNNFKNSDSSSLKFLHSWNCMHTCFPARPS